MQRVLIECIAHDSELEADMHDLERINANKSSDKYSIITKTGPREAAYQAKMQKYAMKSPEGRELVMAPVTLLTTKEYLELGESANYYRNLAGKSKA